MSSKWTMCPSCFSILWSPFTTTSWRRPSWDSGGQRHRKKNSSNENGCTRSNRSSKETLLTQDAKISAKKLAIKKKQISQRQIWIIIKKVFLCDFGSNWIRLLNYVLRIQRIVRKISVSENDGSIRLSRSQVREKKKKSAEHPVSKTRWDQWSCHQKCFVSLSDEDRSCVVTSEGGLILRKWNWKKRMIRSRLSICAASVFLIPKNRSKYWIHIHSIEIKCTTI